MLKALFGHLHLGENVDAAWLLGTAVFVGVFWLVIPRIRR